MTAASQSARRQRLLLRGVLVLCLTAAGGCGSDNGAASVDPSARVVQLPGAMRPIDFDDIVYSQRLRRVLVPARRSGLYLIDPRSGEAVRLGHLSGADSADEGEGRLFVLDREARTVTVLDASSGRTLAAAETVDAGDYLRYVPSTRELWVSQPAASPPGIEIYALAQGSARAPRPVDFVPVPDGTEGLLISEATGKAYTHAGTDVVAIDLASRRVATRWRTGCTGTHGFPRVDPKQRLLVASCDDNGEVVLLDLDDGRRLGRYAVGGGEALPGLSAPGRFEVRADPGAKLAVLTASPEGLRLLEAVKVPDVGHCLTGDGHGRYWTCDAEGGRILQFSDH